MANTYTQVYLQFVFAPKYITGIAQANKHKLVAINGMPDHVYMLIGDLIP